MSRLVVIVLTLVVFASSSAAQAQAAREERNGAVVLSVIWHEGNLADLLMEIAAEYRAKTGVTIQGTFAPLGPDWHGKIAETFARQSADLDLVVFDSQSMSEFASRGHVEQLNARLSESAKLSQADFDPTALHRYAEYPEGSGNLYALPINQDCMGLVYRKDLLSDPQEKEAFRKKHGRELDVPETYDEMLEVAAFFTRPEENLYGIGLYGSDSYDACTSAFNCLLWSYGGDLWDAATRRVKGVLNAPVSVRALQGFTQLFSYAPPGATDWYATELNRAIESGQVAMAINWYYFFSAHLDPARSVVASKLGFAALPGAKGPDGVLRRHVSVGGQGISISAYSRHKEQAWKFLEWFMSEEQQWKWVNGGGKTGRRSILTDPKFLKATPYNETFAFSMGMTKDYWHVPEYVELLELYQKHIHAAVSGKVSAQDALDKTAEEHEEILRRAGYVNEK